MAAPADPSSGGADVQRPAAPTGEAPTSPPSAPPDPPEDSVEALAGRMADYLATRSTPWKDEAVMREATIEAVTQLLTQAQDNVWRLIGDRPPPSRPPSDRQLAARVFAAMREVDPTDAGPVTTPEEATFLRQWAQRTLDAWKAKNVPTNGAAKSRPAPSPKVNAATFGQRPARITPTAARIGGKRHALDCSCLGCKPAKAVGK